MDINKYAAPYRQCQFHIDNWKIVFYYYYTGFVNSILLKLSDIIQIKLDFPGKMLIQKYLG